MKNDRWPRAEQLRFPALALSLGATIFARTRWDGTRELTLRLVGISTSGRPYVIGHDRYGLCHRVWSKNIIQAIPANRKDRHGN